MYEVYLDKPGTNVDSSENPIKLAMWNRTNYEEAFRYFNKLTKLMNVKVRVFNGIVSLNEMRGTRFSEPLASPPVRPTPVPVESNADENVVKSTAAPIMPTQHEKQDRKTPAPTTPVPAQKHQRKS